MPDEINIDRHEIILIKGCQKSDMNRREANKNCTRKQSRAIGGPINKKAVTGDGARA